MPSVPLCCPTYFSETKKTLLAGLKTPVSVIWQVLKARTEGMGLNAAARTFEKAKNTTLNLSEFVVGYSWHTCPRMDRDKAPLVSRD